MKKKHLFWIIPLTLLFVLFWAFCCYAGIFYHADAKAKEALVSNDDVNVSFKNSYCIFDGKGEDKGLIIYPGGKVEYTAYAPLCMELAKNGIDVFLVDMPFNFSFFNMNAADKIINEYNYDNWYIGGHSLGGACASIYASKNSSKVQGLILLASYSTKEISEDVKCLLIHGDNDKVLNLSNYNKCLTNCINREEYLIEGGNHASFGSYGEQKGDGKLSISSELVISETVDFIVNNL